jgi:hypothetical protein
MADRLLDLCDAIVSSLATAFPTVSIDDTDLDVTVAWTSNPKVDISDSAITSPLVWVLDWGETLDTENGVPYEQAEVLIVVQMKRGATQTDSTFVRAMSALASQITRHFRPRDGSFELTDANCTMAQRRYGKDLADWNNDGRFYAEIATSWRVY